MEEKSAMELLIEALKGDHSYAWSWHCNLAMAMYDAKIPAGKANDIAGRIMKQFFDVDTREFREYGLVSKAKKGS
jgi:hypothetical protein